MVASSAPVRVASYPPGSSYGPRTARDFEFVWILRGSAEWRRLGSTEEQIVLRPGQLALARPGAVDSYRWDPDRETVHAYVHFALLERGDLTSESEWPLVRSLVQPAALDGLCAHLVQSAGQEGEPARRHRDRILAALLELFVVGSGTAGADPLPQPAVRAVVEAVRDAWRHDLVALPVPALARAAGVSTGHLFRIFRTEYGCSPARALELVRLARAATLLQRSNATLAEIAHRCGFANPYHFSRRFAAVYGLPPGAYRTAEEVHDPYDHVRAVGLLPIAHALLQT